jgi:hypothetical protein
LLSCDVYLQSDEEPKTNTMHALSRIVNLKCFIVVGLVLSFGLIAYVQSDAKPKTNTLHNLSCIVNLKCSIVVHRVG